MMGIDADPAELAPPGPADLAALTAPGPGAPGPAVDADPAVAAVSAERDAFRAELEETSRGLLAVYAELTDRTEELERARAEAEQAGEAKAAFLANMSHEIRSPLNAVIGFTSLLLETGLTAEQTEYAETVRTAGDHLRGVIDDILDLSKIESGRLELENIPFDLVTCVEDAVAMVAPRAEEKSLALATLFAADVPATVVGDPVRLRQILMNLLANAVKFTSAGDVVVDVTATCANGRAELRLDVRDTGIGIAPDAIERVFAPFTQADTSTTRNFGGTGLGLSICRELAQRMGGGVEVASTPGAGSTFTCTVLVDIAPPGPDAEPGPDLTGLRVLVAHEQPVVVEAVRRHLAGWGAEVVSVAPVAVGHRAAGTPIDLIIGDAGSTATAAEVPAVTIARLSDRPSGPDGAGHLVRTPVRRRPLRDGVLAALNRRPVRAQAFSASSALSTFSALSADVAANARDNQGPLRILVAEDNPMNQRATTLILGRLGHRVDVVPDGQQAVDAILAAEYDLVLMDLHMPHLDGMEATRLARLHRPERPRIVALTAGATDENRRACLHVGMNDFLTKPVEPRDLARVLADTQRVYAEDFMR
jgi:signal transduction histidine kinase/CheY-like chemotaxis protein